MGKTHTELQGMDIDDAREYIELFAEEFGSQHLYFAQHAAFPLALTPDLLYRLWINFQRNSRDEKRSIPWIAVADLLLSPLCKEVGHELYEMDLTIRAELLNMLKNDENLGMSRIYELSNFLLDYVRQQLSNNSNTRTTKLANAQRWTALAYTQPSKAARELSEALDALSQNKAEHLRVGPLIEALSVLAEPERFEPLLVRVRSLEDTEEVHIPAEVRLVDEGAFAHAYESIEEIPIIDAWQITQDRVGQQLGNYRLLKLLGKGGFAQVYLGKHIHLQSEAVIKVLNETRLTPEDQQGFRTEARTIRGLKHPHIVKVLDFGIEKSLREADAGAPYLVMEYAPNGTLRDRHPRNSIVALDQIGLYTDQMADALQYAHNQFIVHCDVKPENMLIAGQNDILLSGFGIAITRHTSNNPSVVHKIQGSIVYVAPERLGRGITEPACDQYALGVIVYEWLTGVRPFEGTRDQVIYQHINTPPPPLYSVYRHITQDIERVVMKALAKDPKQRYSSVKEFARELSHALLSASQPALPHSVAQQQSASAAPHPHFSSEPTVFFPNMRLPDPSEFYGRILERTQLLSRVRYGGCTSIVGSRRSGKTWLMSYLRLVAPERLGANFRIGYMSATLPSSTTRADFTGEALKALGYPPYSLPPSPDLALLAQFVRDMVAQKRMPILCIDEFEGLTHHPAFDSRFFEGLRAITEVGLVLIVLSKEPLIDLMSKYTRTSPFLNIFKHTKTSPFLNIFLQLTLHPFDRTDAEQFVQKKGAQAQFTEQERAYLLAYSQSDKGQFPPLRLQLAGETLLNEKRAAVTAGQHHYRPSDPEYWQAFKKRVDVAYKGFGTQRSDT
jgi:serine/threonine protein kinase